MIRKLLHALRKRWGIESYVPIGQGEDLVIEDAYAPFMAANFRYWSADSCIEECHALNEIAVHNRSVHRYRPVRLP